jgi:membrane fusion protein, multidrug efflux system
VIGAIRYDVGERFTAGAMLAALDTTELAAGQAQARAARDKAARDLARAEQLYRDDVIAKVQRDDAKTALEVATAALTSTQFNQRKGELIAPADGTVLRRFAEPGEIAAPGAPIIAIAVRDAGRVLRVQLPDRDLVQLTIGDPAEVSFDAFPNQSFSAKVSSIASAANPQNGLFDVELALVLTPEVEARMASGLVGRARIAAAALATSGALSIPLMALVEANGNEASVYVVATGQIAQRRRIQIGAVVEERVEVLGGLTADSRVVTRGAAFVLEGTVVAPQTTAAAGVARAAMPEPRS